MTYTDVVKMHKRAWDFNTEVNKLKQQGVPIVHHTQSVNTPTWGLYKKHLDGSVELSKDPLAFARGSFKPDKAGEDALQQQEQLTQKARKSYGGAQSRGVYDIRVPWARWAELFRGRKGRLEQAIAKNRYVVSKDIAPIFAPETNSAPGQLWVPDERYYEFYNPSLINPLDPLFHENNHYFTPQRVPMGTDGQSAITPVIPGFLYGSRVDYKDSLMASRRKSAERFPGYRPHWFPDSYYNSLPEMYTAARTQKQYLAAKHAIPSVGLNADLSDKRLSNGTLPFNAAMVQSGQWRVNPKYTGGFTGHNGSYVPKYQIVPGSKAPYVVRNEGSELMKQINFMQYLLDLGDKRTPQQTKLLKKMQQRLPYIYETAQNSIPRRSYRGVLQQQQETPA